MQVVGVDVYNFTLTNDVGRCLSTSGGGLNEHIPIVIISTDDETSNRSGFIQSMPYGEGGNIVEKRKR